MRRWATIGLVAMLAEVPCWAQFGDILQKAQDKTQKVQDKTKSAKKAADIYTPWTADQERVIGEASAAKLVNILGLYDQPDMTKYVNLVGNVVVRQGARPLPYHFGILDTEAITAVSLPGGYVFVTRGALANIRSEAELAGVLAHEIAHVDRRHLEKQTRTSKTVQLAKEEASTRIPSGAQLVAIAGDVVKNALTLQVSRDGENEADKLGMDLAARAGYQASGLHDFLQVLATASGEPANQQRLGLWGSTHPPFNERVSRLAALLPNYSSQGQVLQDRYNWYVNPLSFNKGPASAGIEVDGVVQHGAVVLQGGNIPDGTKVKVRVEP